MSCIDRFMEALAKALGWNKPDEMEYLPLTPSVTAQEPPGAPLPTNTTPMPSTIPSTVPESDIYTLRPWTTQKNYFHNVGVLCDRSSLTYAQKDIVRRCIYIESRFRDYFADGTPVKNPNKDKTGAVWSIDWGLVQINDWAKFKHIGPGCMFSSFQDVLSHPERSAQYMIDTMKETGRLQPWASYTGTKDHPAPYKDVPTAALDALRS